MAGRHRNSWHHQPVWVPFDPDGEPAAEPERCYEPELVDVHDEAQREAAEEIAALFD